METIEELYLKVEFDNTRKSWDEFMIFLRSSNVSYWFHLTETICLHKNGDNVITVYDRYRILSPLIHVKYRITF